MRPKTPGARRRAQRAPSGSRSAPKTSLASCAWRTVYRTPPRWRVGIDQLRTILLSRRFLTGSSALRPIFSKVGLAPDVCQGTPEEDYFGILTAKVRSWIYVLAGHVSRQEGRVN